MSIKKVMLITNIISPYRIPLLNKFNESNKFKLKVLALSEKEENRQWKLDSDQIDFSFEILPGWHKFIWNLELPLHLNRGVFKTLKNNEPDVIIVSGYNNIAYWQALLYAKVTGKKIIFWAGSTLMSANKIGGMIGSLKSLFIKSVDWYVTYGTKTAEYLKYFGAKGEYIHIGLNTVDVDKFKNKSLDYIGTEEYKKRRSKYPRILLLFVGQLIKRKGILQLLRALNKLPSSNDIGLLVVGSGPQREKLEKFVDEHSLDDIYFEGFQDREKLYKYYSMADVFVLPSLEEVWGLVVNEALASGLFVLASDKAGSSYDLIKTGWNGDIFDPREPVGLAELINYAKDNIHCLRSRRQAISEHTSENYNIERYIEAFDEAIHASLE